ncbi:MAG: translation initiation factor IF-3 [Candidatus Omnitrophota bacterium]|jgi:translation initiation factor IF-3|nr:MAG: translation initiation factor IF-3 [Candidatus Omnitrophota bacterium]
MTRETSSVDTTRINEAIREREVRLVSQSGDHIGVIPIDVALAKARESGLDLVEVSAKSKPHVCRIMDYGQYKYQQAKKQKEAKKKQKQIVVKEIKLRPRIEQHDYEFKLNHAIKFLEHGDKVRFIMQFRGREMAHKELGQKIMEQFILDLEAVAQVEQAPKQEGRFMNMTLAPLPASKMKKSKSIENEDELFIETDDELFIETDDELFIETDDDSESSFEIEEKNREVNDG